MSKLYYIIINYFNLKILIFFINYDIINITNINKNINVGKVLDEDKNRIINYNEKIKIESELMLIINADFKNN